MPDPSTALVTGASAGIGLALCEQLAARGFNLVIVARRQARLESLAKKLGQQHGVTVTPLVADLADPSAPVRLAGQLEKLGIDVDWLVNNAGYGVPGAFLSVDWLVHQQFLQVMVNASAHLSWLLLPGMKRRGQGKIVNIASLAGLVPSSGGHTLYGAVKSAMVHFSQALAGEMQAHGVTVTAVCPGFTYSEFHDVSGLREQVSKMPRVLWMTADAVATQALAAADRGDVVYVNGWLNRMIWRLSRYLPRRLFLALTSGQSRKFRNTN